MGTQILLQWLRINFFFHILSLSQNRVTKDLFSEDQSTFHIMSGGNSNWWPTGILNRLVRREEFDSPCLIWSPHWPASFWVVLIHPEMDPEMDQTERLQCSATAVYKNSELDCSFMDRNKTKFPSYHVGSNKCVMECTVLIADIFVSMYCRLQRLIWSHGLKIDF